jgi:hypothetical protein
MIKNERVSREISELMLDIGRRLDASVATVELSCGESELRAYRRAVGKVLGEVLLEVLNPLYREHPGLKPAGLR